MAAGAGDRLYDGLFYSYPAGHCHYHDPGQCYSGTEAGVDMGFRTNRFTIKSHKGVTVMKKRNIVIHSLGLLILIVMLTGTFAACASTRTQSSPGAYIDDSVITTKVKSLLAGDDFLKSFQIGVESHNGIVQLSGFVDSQKAIDKAVQITKSVEGVKSIRNDLIVKK
jgi:hypothetical protein